MGLRLVSEPGPNFAAYLAARLIFVTVLLGIAALYRPGNELSIYGALFTANVFLSLGGWELYRRHVGGTVLRWLVLSAAVVIDTGVLRVSGGSHSEFVFLYFFSVGAAGLMVGMAGSLWVAALSTAGIIWLDAQVSGLANVNILRLFGFAANFALTALLTSAMYSWMQKREARHRETLGELAQTKLDTQAILDCLSTGLIVVDHAGNLLYTNPSGIDILGLPLSASKDDVERFARATGLALMKSDMTAGQRRELAVRTGTGFRPLGFSVSPLGSPGHDVRGRIILFNDLTSLKERERQEMDRERLAAVGALSRDLAHEIRNPLATVQGCIEMITHSASASPEHVRYLQLALKESDRLNKLIADFLIFAHLGQPKKENFDLSAMIRSRLGKVSGCKIEDELAANYPVDADPDQAVLIVDGILLALAEWMEGQGKIRIESSPSREWVRFVSQELVIPDEVRESAFRPLSGAEKRSRNLALPTALKAVHAHGGSLKLESRPAIGTVLELSL